MSTMQGFRNRLVSAHDAAGRGHTYIQLLSLLTAMNLAQVAALDVEWNWWS